MLLNELTDGTEIDQVLLVREVERRQRRDGGDYLRVQLGDRTGAVACMIWDELAEVQEIACAGAPVRVRGRYTVHPRFGPQINLRGLEAAEPGTFEMNDLLDGPVRDVELMESEIRELIDTIQEPHLGILLECVFGEDSALWAGYRVAPAAKYYHQAYRHGLLEHSLGVAQAVSAISATFPGIDRDVAISGALLHDIGKLEVPASVLNKKGSPDHDEWAVIHRHPEEGARLMEPLLPWLGEWGRAVVEHHERFDGTGYPHGLRGDEISRAARMVTVADCYEVMTGPRTYKRPMSVVSARAELVHVAGSQLDPAVVRALLNVSIGRLWRVVGLGAWLAQAPLLHRLFSNAGTWLAPGVAATATAAVLLAGGLSGATPTPTVALAGPVTYAPGLATAAPPGRPPASDRDSPPAGLSGTPTAPVASAPVASAPAATSTARSGASGAAVAPVHAPGLDSSAAGPCTTHCVGNNNGDCVSYCTGNYNTACTASCTGNNDEACVRDCHGNHDVNCVSACGQSARSAARRPVVP